VPFPWNFAAGAAAIVVTYSAGLGDISFGNQVPRGSCYVYDVATGTWRPGPTAPIAPGTVGPAYWTPYRVLSLGESFGGRLPALAHIGGWLLRMRAYAQCTNEIKLSGPRPAPGATAARSSAGTAVVTPGARTRWRSGPRCWLRNRRPRLAPRKRDRHGSQ